MERLEFVREYREGKRPARKKENADFKKPGISARSLASTPAKFHVTVIPTKPFLAVPENTVSTRNYPPLGWLSPPTIPSNKLRFIKDADIWHFSILTSRMHTAWLRYIGGRIKSDFQYTIGIVYKHLPLPTPPNEKVRNRIRALGEAVLDARRKYPGSTLADLYDLDTMPQDLSKAHQALDLAIDKLYRKEPFTSDRERVEHLFKLYEELTAPMLAASAKPKRGRARGAQNGMPFAPKRKGNSKSQMKAT